MTTKNKQFHDCVDKLLGALLSYRELAVDLCSRSQEHSTTEDVDVYAESGMPHLDQKPKKVKEAFVRLQEIRDARTATWIDDKYKRHEDYFWQIFPYQGLWQLKSLERGMERLERKGIAVDKSQETVVAATKAYRIAEEMVGFDRLLMKDPDEWKESAIFQKETHYAKQTYESVAFRKHVGRFLFRHRKQFKERVRIGWIRRADTELVFNMCRHRAGVECLGDWQRFQYDFNHLCEQYCLIGMSRQRPFAVPERFEMGLDDTHMVIKIPNYMTLDWRRDVPGDVIKMLQRRGTWLHHLSYSHKNRLMARSKKPPEGFVARYYELHAETDKDGVSLAEESILCMLAKEFELCDSHHPDGSAAERDTLIRQARRVLRRAGVSWQN